MILLKVTNSEKKKNNVLINRLEVLIINNSYFNKNTSTESNITKNNCKRENERNRIFSKVFEVRETS